MTGSNYIKDGYGMAYYRQIYTTFWTDPKVADEFTPEDKYFYLYLLTNNHTNLCGCYEISKKQISVDTGYNVDTVERLINRLQKIHGVIAYNGETKELFLVNWHKYNWSKSEKLLKGVANEYDNIKSTGFQMRICELLEEYGYDVDTLSIRYTYPMDTSVTVTDTVTDIVTDPVNSAIKLLNAFETFWNEYPKKVGKKDAKRAFDKALKSVKAETMIRAVIAQKKSGQWLRENGRYIPNPSTWLNQGRWDDEIQPVDTPGMKLKNAPSEQHPYDKDEIRRRAKE